MEASQLIHVLQELHELLQTNKLSSIVGLGKAYVVLVQSLTCCCPQGPRGHCSHFIGTVELPYYNGDTQTNPVQEHQEQQRLLHIRYIQKVMVAVFLILFVCCPRCN